MTAIYVHHCESIKIKGETFPSKPNWVHRKPYKDEQWTRFRGVLSERDVSPNYKIIITNKLILLCKQIFNHYIDAFIKQMIIKCRQRCKKTNNRVIILFNIILKHFY